MRPAVEARRPTGCIDRVVQKAGLLKPGDNLFDGGVAFGAVGAVRPGRTFDAAAQHPAEVLLGRRKSPEMIMGGIFQRLGRCFARLTPLRLDFFRLVRICQLGCLGWFGWALHHLNKRAFESPDGAMI
jgi:hypothetical protein